MLRDQEYYEANIGNVTSVDEFINDRRLFGYAMKAHGLEDMTYAKAFMKKVLQSDLTDAKSFARQLVDSRYAIFARAFSFATDGSVKPATPFVQSDFQIDDTIGLYSEHRVRQGTAVAAETQYYQTRLATLTSVDQLVGDERLFSYALTAFGIDPKHASESTIRNVLTSDISDPQSTANTLGNVRYVALAAAFNFESDGSVGAGGAHEAVTAGVFPVGRVVVGRRTFTGVVVARVSQAQGMTDFMGQGLTTVVVQVRRLVDVVATARQIPRSTVITWTGAWQVGECCRAILTTTVVTEGHVTVTAKRLFGEGDIGHVGPGLHGERGLCFLLRAELTEPGDTVLVHGARRGRGQERVGEFDFAAAVLVLVGSAVTQQLGSSLVDGEGGFAIDREIATPIILMAETIDLVVGGTGCSQRWEWRKALFGKINSVVFYFRHKHTSLFSNGTVFVRYDNLWRDRPITRPMKAYKN